MKKILTFCALVFVLGLGLMGVSTFLGPNQYAARIAEAQADIETARAIQDQARALDHLGQQLGRVSMLQALALLFLVVGLVAGLGLLVYWRTMPGCTTVPKAIQADLKNWKPETPGLEAGTLDPALLNQVIQIEMLRALRGMNTPTWPGLAGDGKPERQ